MGTSTESGSKMRRGIAGLALVGAVALGGLVVAVVNPLSSAGAADGTTTTVPATPEAPTAPKQQSRIVTEALSSLVADGTLTQAQADKVQERLRTTAQQVRGDRKAKRTATRQDLIGTAATALGVSTDELEQDIRGGKTIKQIAEERNVELSKVTDALVAEADRLVDAAVTEGRIDQARADTIKERAGTRIQRFVEQGGRRLRTGG